MEAFTCLLYGGKEASCVNDLRYNKIRGKCCSTDETFDASKNIDQIIHTGGLFTAIQQAGKSLHLQKQIL
jgi:hypothetical protein